MKYTEEEKQLMEEGLEIIDTSGLSDEELEELGFTIDDDEELNDEFLYNAF